ncbi:hypothetical protein EKO27_g1788 [Xylaria grammica]|uniref:Aminoglycoside phosphotransferase domain-containing protein n=1 Tax=Xylaria grammica TaxID=363999 RepID=A0A439DG04_9PEZI|nr:hypothetical protein EKO27_g1788 [Xylaria grammica]
MASASTTPSTAATMGAKLIGVLGNSSRPVKLPWKDEQSGEIVERRSGVSKPTECLFLADDGSWKWVAVNAGVFPGEWYWEDTSHLVFPPFPTGSWNVGQIGRLENGEVGFKQTLEKTLEGSENAWHPTKIDFAELELISQLKHECDPRVWQAKHPLFDDKMLLGAVIGFILEWIEGGRTTMEEDQAARIEAVKKLHALGITHGCAHHLNFLKKGEDVLMVDFEEARFGDKATEKRKEEDIRRICDFEGDMFTNDVIDEADFAPQVNYFFDNMVDDEINWSDDSEAARVSDRLRRESRSG